MRILIVDDNAPTRLNMAKLFQAGGYEVCLAGNGIEALNMLREKGDEIDFILLDIVMPEMDGLEFMSKAVEEGLLKQPVGVISGSVIRGVLLELATKMPGIEFVFQKPIDLKKMEELFIKMELVNAKRKEASRERHNDSTSARNTT